MKLRLLTGVLILLFNTATAQDYTNYHRLVVRADGDILAGNFNAAPERFDTLYRAYDLFICAIA